MAQFVRQKTRSVVSNAECECGCGALRNKCLFKKIKKRDKPSTFINMLLLVGIYANALKIDKGEVKAILNKLRSCLIWDCEWFKKRGKQKGKMMITNLEASQNRNLHFREIMKIMHIAQYLSTKIDNRLAFVLSLNIIYGIFILEATMIDLTTLDFYGLFTQDRVRHTKQPIGILEYNRKLFKYSMDPIVGKILYSDR